MLSLTDTADCNAGTLLYLGQASQPGSGSMRACAGSIDMGVKEMDFENFWFPQVRRGR